jgi:glucokinase
VTSPCAPRSATRCSPVAIDNDAKALAFGEGRWGAAVGVDDYLAMVVSTGVGGGIVCDGRLLDGACGQRRPYRPRDRGAGRPSVRVRCADVSRPRCRARRSQRSRGAPAPRRRSRCAERTGRLVGRAVASVAALLDLRLALVAGSVALGYGAEFFDAARTELERSARLSFVRGIEIDPPGSAIVDRSSARQPSAWPPSGVDGGRARSPDVKAAKPLG